MRNRYKAIVFLTGLLATSLVTAAWAGSPKMKMTTDIPQSITTPDNVDTSIGTLKFFDGIPDKTTVGTLYDYMDRARAVQAYLAGEQGEILVSP